MSKPQRELDELFAALVATRPQRRDATAEADRRLRISRAIQARIDQGGATRASAALSRPVRLRWAVVAVAAAVTLGLGFAGLVREPALTLEPEVLSRGPRETTGLAEPDAIRSEPSAALSGASAEPVRRAKSGRSAESQPRPSATSASSEQAPPAASGGRTPPPEASLAQANVLFERAVRAARHGDDDASLRQFEALLERHPDSPLAADARVRRFRTLARLGRSAEAQAAAQQYLELHPKGFAVGEARDLLDAGQAGSAPSLPQD